MADWEEIRDREAGEFLISGSITREEFEAETASLRPRSLFDRRLKSVIKSMLEEEDEEHYIHVDALIRTVDSSE